MANIDDLVSRPHVRDNLHVHRFDSRLNEVPRTAIVHISALLSGCRVPGGGIVPRHHRRVLHAGARVVPALNRDPDGTLQRASQHWFRPERRAPSVAGAATLGTRGSGTHRFQAAACTTPAKAPATPRWWIVIEPSPPDTYDRSPATPFWYDPPTTVVASTQPAAK
jgi:hypothetical protein